MRNRYLFTVLVGAGLALMISLPSPAEESASKEKIDRLIQQLGSDVFAEREAATKELAVIGPPALEALRKAVKSNDAEVRKRAEELIPKAEKLAENQRILAPKRIHLVYKDTPLSEAAADFQKKSGYSIHLYDLEGKLKERKITLDTGTTTFWHALDLFCAKAELTEANMADLIQAPQSPRIRGGRSGFSDRISLKDGKAKKRPTDDRGAIRIRALGKSDLFDKAPEGEMILPLEITPEPRLQLQSFQSIRVEQAVDDRGRKLTQVIPQVEGVSGFALGNRVIALPGGGVMYQGNGGSVTRRDILHPQAPVQLKRGAKAVKSLKELKGILTAGLLTEVRPMITADKLKAGETFKGEEGGSIKIVEVKSEEEQTTLRVDLELPPPDKITPAHQVPGMGAIGAPMRPRGQGKILPAPGARIRKGGAIAIAVKTPSVGPINGMCIQDDKDNALPIQISQTQLRVAPQANGMLARNLTYTLLCPHGKDKGRPAKIVYLGRKRVTVDIPFALTDVPLP